MPVTQPDAWVAPPFEAKVIPGSQAGLPDIPRVLIGRGATNSKGPEMSQLNALMAYKAVNGKLPVNVIFIAEGDEERMDIGAAQVHQGPLGPAGRSRCALRGRAF